MLFFFLDFLVLEVEVSGLWSVDCAATVTTEANSKNSAIAGTTNLIWNRGFKAFYLPVGLRCLARPRHTALVEDRMMTGQTKKVNAGLSSPGSGGGIADAAGPRQEPQKTLSGNATPSAYA